MIVEAQVTINGPKEAIWAVITDIANAADSISGIDRVEILEQPAHGFVGLKWRETRTLFGKAAVEDMWITEAVENEFYEVGAESHGFKYVSTISISEHDGGNSLTMTHESTPQRFSAKVMSIPMGLFKGAMKKTFLQDLNDIKAAVEQSTRGR